MDETERKKAALERIKQLLQDPEVQQNLQKGRMFGPGTDIKGLYEKMGMSGAPLSQTQGTEKLYSAPDAKQTVGGYPGMYGEQVPESTIPAYNRAGGPLDITPSGAAADLTAGFLDPRFRMGGIAGAGIQKFIPRTMTSVEQKAALLKAGHPAELPPELQGQPFYGSMPSSSDSALEKMAQQDSLKQTINKAPAEIQEARSTGEATEPGFDNIKALFKKKQEE